MADGRESDRPALYQITVQGNLDKRWSDWFDGFTITRPAEGESCLTGVVVDQAALYGLLAKIWDLGLPLLSVRKMPAVQNREE